MIAQIIVPRPIERIFHYLVPSSLKSRLRKGQVVRIPFGGKEILGYVVGIQKKSPRGLKEILDIVVEDELLDEKMLKLSQWISSYYYASWGECINAMIPSPVKKGTKPRHKYKFKEDFRYKIPSSLTTAQKNALEEISKVIKEKKHMVFLLYGVTASGKTEVYMRAIEIALKAGRGAIVLVPEIALTPQTVSRFYLRFKDLVSVMHSKLTAGQRYWEWSRIKKGEAKVVIGARSAIFAPLKETGIIVVDEEHELTYKQKETPRYHAREVAIKRAELESAAVILGSATPSLESFYLASIGKYKLLKLPQRIVRKKMPQVQVVDMRGEKWYRAQPPIFSHQLKMELEKTIERNRQAVLFLNRRGFSTYIYCLKCGWVMKCPRCEIALTYHSMKKILLCHYCNYSEKATIICPKCNSNYLSYRGIGTQKVESQLHRLFPSIKTERLDSDAIKKRGKLEQIIENFREKKIDILIGTQLVAKGHDFPEVDLVGVILADIGLNIVDFRADERSFCLLTQVAGRAGRGEEKGKVIIQTYSPQHYAIRYAIKQDYLSFYKKEIERRKELDFPPFSHFIKLTIKGKKEENVKNVIEKIRENISQISNNICDILGPAPHPLLKLRGYYRWQLILKGKNVEEMTRLLYNILGYKKKIKGCWIIVDVDPYEE